MSRNFLILHRASVLLLIYLIYCLCIYSTIIPQFLKYTEKYYISRTTFHFRRCAEAVLRRAARLSKAFSTAPPSTPKKRFYTSIWAVLDEKVLARLSTARRLKYKQQNRKMAPALSIFHVSTNMSSKITMLFTFCARSNNLSNKISCLENPVLRFNFVKCFF